MKYHDMLLHFQNKPILKLMNGLMRSEHVVYFWHGQILHHVYQMHAEEEGVKNEDYEHCFLL